MDIDPDRGNELVLPLLMGRTVVLRSFQPNDAPMIQEASGDPLIPLITSVPSDNSVDAALAFIERQHQRLQVRAGYSFAIADENDRAVGQIGLWLRDEDYGRASVGYWIRPSARQRGYAADALLTLVTWALALPNLHRLELYVEPWNEGSWRAAEKVGFQREGLLHAWQQVSGVYRDMFIYSLVMR
ncbi:GNAT family N-acetyltransferase [Cryobacterium sp. CG_9.6]|uniref:GNAT family N-acetyltransferase n=1 Tax=Cryobacterium sp. CG_9.6 TaxID=2760710 RepID=UPI002474E780|nr:GNAT family N-acetyltransferase [Cryobacterium sp. CG_9.6]MDH6238377.1 RimJ/RimL family protein N-acetyltransferase [Cryobacterium sp. CG_9.6]